jgi:hypothetical protein
MDRINELVGRLADLSADELAELNALIREQAAALAGEPSTPDVADATTALADALDSVRTEETRRAEAQAEVDARRQAAMSRLDPAATETEPEGDDPDEDDDQDDDSGDLPAPAGEPAPQAEPQPEAVAASNRPRIPAQRQPLAGRLSARTRPAAPAAPGLPQARTTVTAVDTGRTLKTRGEIVSLMASAVDARPAHDMRVVRATTEYPAERRLQRGERPENDAIVAAALQPESLTPQALVAAGGLCAPVENLYDVDVIGSDARPVRAGLPSFQADRGGVSLRPGVVFSDWAGAVSDWTLANDIDAATAGGEDPTKPIIEALCPGFTSYYVEATVARVRFRNITARFDPEGTAANLKALDVAFARKAENKLLTKMAGLSVTQTESKRLGAARDALVAYDKLLSQLQSFWRFDDSVALATYAPMWFKNMLRADITRGELSMDALAAADETIASWFTKRGVNIRWHLDGRASAQSSGAGVPAIAAQQYGALVSGTTAVPGFPAQVEFLIYREGDFLLLDGGELNLGTVRDTTTNAVNAYELFKEEFEGLAFRGTTGTAVQLVASFEPMGGSAGRIDSSGFTD